MTSPFDALRQHDAEHTVLNVAEAAVTGTYYKGGNLLGGIPIPMTLVREDPAPGQFSASRRAVVTVSIANTDETTKGVDLPQPDADLVDLPFEHEAGNTRWRVAEILATSNAAFWRLRLIGHGEIIP